MCEDGEGALHRVLQDPDLLLLIFTACAEEYDQEQVYTYCPHAEAHPLLSCSKVNRIFRSTALRLIFTRVTFSTYARYHPANALDDTMASTYAFYQTCAKVILFPTLDSLRMQLPFFVNQSSSLRFLRVSRDDDDAYYPPIGSRESNLVVDLKKRNVHLTTTARFDLKGRVLIRTVDYFDSDLGVEQWPRGYKIARTLDLTIDVYSDYDQREVSPGEIVKIIPLDELLSKWNDSTGPCIESEQIRSVSLPDYQRNDISPFESILRHSPLQTLDMLRHNLNPSAVLAVIRQSNLRSISLRGCPDLGVFWSAMELYQVIQAFTNSSSHQFTLSLKMTYEEWSDIPELLSSDQELRSRTALEVYMDISPPRTGEADFPKVKVLKKLLPRWHWLRSASPKATINQRLIVFISLQ